MALIVVLRGTRQLEGAGNLRAGPSAVSLQLGSAVLMVGQGLSGGIVANHGQSGDAEKLVCSMAALAAQTGLLSGAVACWSCLTSSPRQPRSPKRALLLPTRLASMSAKATCPEPVSRSGTLPNPHLPERVPSHGSAIF